MRTDECIHSLRVVLELFAGSRGKCVASAFGSGSDEQQPLLAIVLQRRRPYDLGQLSEGCTAERIHLPQPVLGGVVALREQQIMRTRGADVGHTLRVADDGDGRGKANNFYAAINLGQGSARLEVKPSTHTQGHRDDHGQQQTGDTQCDV